MRVWVINLDKNTDRLALITERLGKQGISFERLPAIYGRTLSADEKRRLVAFWKWWCVRGTYPRDGEIGAVASHLAVYQRLIDSGEPCCCVLEDDDHLDARFKEQLDRIESWIEPTRPQVVLMTNYTGRDGGDIWRIEKSDGDSSAEAYVITAAAARNLLARNSPACTPSDVWGFWVRRKVIELYHAFPTVVPSTWRLPGYKSEVCPEGEAMVRVSEMNLIAKICWKIKRVIGLALARLFI